MKKFEFLKVIIGLSIFIIFAGINSCNYKKETEPISIRYASVKAIVEAPAHIAYHNGYFKEEGLDLSLEINPDGKTSLERMLLDSIDIASVMATPVVYKSFERNDFCIFAVMEFSEKIHSCIVRKNTGINSLEDLKGKTIGVMKGTSGEFFMNSFLILNEILPTDLNISNLNGPQMVSAIENKEIDAMFCWEPYPEIARKKLGDNTFKLSSKELIPSSWVFITKKSFAEANPQILTKFLKGVLSGITFTNENKEKALEVHSIIADVDIELIHDLFYKEIFNLSLKQELILDMETQARWIIDFNYTTDSVMPNFLDMIYFEAAENVFPSQVLIIK